jgi:hypothetical protein
VQKFGSASILQCHPHHAWPPATQSRKGAPPARKEGNCVWPLRRHRKAFEAHLELKPRTGL